MWLPSGMLPGMPLGCNGWPFCGSAVALCLNGCVCVACFQYAEVEHMWAAMRHNAQNVFMITQNLVTAGLQLTMGALCMANCCQWQLCVQMP
jgi:hypothetical protein